MEKQKPDEDNYPIPSTFNVCYPGILIFVFFIGDISALYLLTTSTNFHQFAQTLLMILFVAVLQIDFVHGHILKKQYLEITHSYIRLVSLFSEKILKWNEIQSIRMVNIGKANYIEVTGRKEVGTGLSGTDITIKIHDLKFSNISPTTLVYSLKTRLNK